MTMLSSASATATVDREVQTAIERLSAVLERENFSGWDPYDALSSPALRALARTPLLRRVAIQTLKRLPINPRPLVGVPKQQHTKALALLVSAYARLAKDGAQIDRAQSLARLLGSRSFEVGGGIGWGYDFDVQTRWGYYARGEPNAIATSFVARALLDLASVDGDESHVSLARRTLGFAHSTLLVDRGSAPRFFGYYAGSTTVVHNANLLVSGLFARCDTPETEGWKAAADAMRYSLECQRADGSWPYGEGRGLAWVDGFHTAYVLNALAEWHAVTGDPDIEAALMRGLHFARTRLIDEDGAPRAALAARYPIDIHAASSLIRTFSTLRRYDDVAADTAARILGWTLRYMQRHDGRFAFQLHRQYRNSVPYIRWSDAHMLLALACFATRGDDG